MPNWHKMALLLGMLALPGAASASQIAVSNYGNSVSGMPWVIALEKGFLAQQGTGVTSIISSPGGSGDIRNLIAGGLPYSDSGLVSFLGGIRSGADLRIINENTHSTAQFVWIVKRDSPIASWRDIKGKRITFTTPLSISQAMDMMLVAKAGLQPDEVKLVSTGAYGAAMTALDNGAVDVAIVAEPVFMLNQDRFRVLVRVRDILPAISNTLGIVSTKYAKEHPEVLRGILVAHRQAVAFMAANRVESAEIIGRVFKMSPGVVKEVLDEMLDKPTADGVPFFSLGDINAKGIDRLEEVSRPPGDPAPVDWRKYVDQSFLPDDLKRDLK